MLLLLKQRTGNRKKTVKEWYLKLAICLQSNEAQASNQEKKSVGNKAQTETKADGGAWNVLIESYQKTSSGWQE